MKSLLFTLLLVCTLFPSTFAGKFSLGLRSGLGIYNTMGYRQPEQLVSWDKEVFARYSTNKRLAFEVSVAKFQWKYNDAGPIEPSFNPSEFNYYYETVESHNYQISFSFQYEITPSYLIRHFPVFKYLKNYIGLSISPTYFLDHSVTGLYRTHYYYGTADETHVYDKISPSKMAGLDYSQIINISRHFSISNSLVYRISSFQSFITTSRYHSPLLTDARFSLNFGCQYVF